MSHDQGVEVEDRWARCICLRLKARSWRVSAAARSPAVRIARSGSCRVGGGQLVAGAARVAAMTVSRLLKSWATPPASRPTASIFCI